MQKDNEKDHLNEIFTILKKLGLLKNVDVHFLHFYDEPKMYSYTTFLFDSKDILKQSGYAQTHKNIVARGFSFYSKRDALFKSLMEGIERISLFCYRKQKILYSTSVLLNKPSLNLKEYIANTSINSTRIGWIEGMNLSTHEPTLIPAQLVYLNYLAKNKEPVLFPTISTGAAAGFDVKPTLLRGIYEIIERDAFMSIYLNRITVPRIPIQNIKNSRIKIVYEMMKRYQLEWYLLDFTHDLNIPVYVSILVDSTKTNMGPSISIGVKCSFNKINNILSSLGEALLSRFETKMVTSQMRVRKKRKDITNRYLKTLIWWPHTMQKKIHFLLKTNQISNKIETIKKRHKTEEELNRIITILTKKGYSIYYKNIAPVFFRQKELCVLKVIIPALQPLYMNQNNKKVLTKRLKIVGRYFGKNELNINTFPHPFL